MRDVTDTCVKQYLIPQHCRSRRQGNLLPLFAHLANFKSRTQDALYPLSALRQVFSRSRSTSSIPRLSAPLSSSPMTDSKKFCSLRSLIRRILEENTSFGSFSMRQCSTITLLIWPTNCIILSCFLVSIFLYQDRDRNQPYSIPHFFPLWWLVIDPQSWKQVFQGSTSVCRLLS